MGAPGHHCADCIVVCVGVRSDVKRDAALYGDGCIYCDGNCDAGSRTDAISIASCI